MSQKVEERSYLLKILEKYGLTEAKTVSTPADPNIKLLKDDGCSKKVVSILINGWKPAASSKSNSPRYCSENVF